MTRPEEIKKVCGYFIQDIYKDLVKEEEETINSFTAAEKKHLKDHIGRTATQIVHDQAEAILKGEF